MKYVEKMNSLIMTILFLWYLFIPIIWINDDTLDIGMKWAYAMVNFLMYSSLIRIRCFGYKSPNIMDFSTFFIMIFWFFFSAYRDAFEPGYGTLERFVYVLIDLLSLGFLTDSFLNFCIQLVSEKLKIKINIFNAFVKVFIISLFSYLTFQLFKVSK